MDEEYEIESVVVTGLDGSTATYLDIEDVMESHSCMHLRNKADVIFTFPIAAMSAMAVSYKKPNNVKLMGVPKRVQ